MEWKLFKADKKRKKWSIRGTLFNGVDVKIPGHRDKAIAEEMRRNIEKLNRAKANIELPPQELIPWLDNLPDDIMDRLIKYGLVDRGRLERRMPVDSFMDAFKDHLKTNIAKTNSLYPMKVTGRIARIFKEIPNLHTFNELKLDAVKRAVTEMRVLEGHRKGQPLSKKTQREYYSGAKAFCDWMIDQGRGVVSPLAKLQLPSAKQNRVYNRRPLSYEDFNKLMAYLETAKPYAKQKYSWTNNDRAMLYWAAVTTGVRQSELKSLTRASFNFDSSPATLTVSGDFSKNGYTETVPLDAVFAEAIQTYTALHLPNAPVFLMPRGQRMIIEGLYRDLDAAGVTRRYPNGDVVDFHTFRSTAICWWLRAGMDILEVKIRARLKTLDLIQEYVRNYVPDYKAVGTKAPSPFLSQSFKKRFG
jgi:integrase